MCHWEIHKHSRAAVQPHLAPLGSTRGDHGGPWGLTNLQTYKLAKRQTCKLFEFANLQTYNLTNLQSFSIFTNLRTHKLTSVPFKLSANFSFTNLQTYKVRGAQIGRHSG